MKKEWAIIKYTFENEEQVYVIHKPSFNENPKHGYPDLVVDDLTREEAEAFLKLLRE